MTECSMCNAPVTSHTHLKNGGWSWGDIARLGITNSDNGYFCASWDGEHLHFYYHGPEAVESMAKDPRV